MHMEERISGRLGTFSGTAPWSCATAAKKPKGDRAPIERSRQMDDSPPPGTHITYSREHRRCGKAACATCRDGPGHGPYWYAVWREGSRVRRRYLGVKAPPELEAPRITVEPRAVAMLRVRTLGGFTVWCGAVEAPKEGWRRRKAGSLFKILLAAPGFILPREQAQEQLWPEAEPAAAARDLHGALYALRKTLGGAAERVHLAGDMLRLEAPEDISWFDAAAFESAAASALAGNNLEAAYAAHTLYTGEYLPDDPYEEWALVRRENLSAQHMALLLHLAELFGVNGELAEAERHLRLALALDPCHEDATTHLMAVLQAAGRRVEALKAYEELSTALARDLGVTPSSDTTALFEQLVAQSTAPVASASIPRHEAVVRRTNIPAPLTSFVGRIAEQSAVRTLLEAARLLTLTGAGGCGKTRLALRVANDLADTFADGVWLVELAATAAGDLDLALPARALAAVLGVAEEPDRPLVDTLTAFLGPRRVLLVLDNCEHLIVSCAELVSNLLTACPDLRVLATSREALGVPGETFFRVTSLTSPPPEVSAADLRAYDASALFLERARSYRPELMTTPSEAAAVAQICIRLDGIPLAIELAAARVAVLSVESLATRLDDCFRLLIGGPRTTLPRQRTLRATLDWSHTLLDEPERGLLRRLAVFAGGWTLEAAETMCVGGSWGADDASGTNGLDVLGNLVGKSLVQAENRQGAMRYRFLEPVRQYAMELLEASGELPKMEERRLEWAVRLTEQAQPALWEGEEQQIWLDRLETEYENCRAALRWAIAQDRAESGLRLAVAIRQFWDVRGYRQEGLDRLETLLGLIGAEATCSPLVWARALIASANLAYGLGNYEQGLRRAEQGRALSTKLGYRHEIALALNVEAMIASDKDDLASAEGFYSEALSLFRSLGDRRRAVGVLGNLGNIAYFRRDFEEAIARYSEVTALVRPLGDAILTSQILSNLGSIFTEIGDMDRAVEALEESLLHARESDAVMQIANALGNLAEVALIAEQFERAAELAHEGAVLLQRSGDRRGVLACILMTARALVGLDRYEGGALLCGAVEGGLQAIEASPNSPEWDGLKVANEAVRLRLGEARFTAAHTRGRTMSPEQVIAMSLNWGAG
jgi:predicted ATPase/DNA-binding SARP family transcriptional activator/Tfp pilus assembly protein PilF